MGEQIKEIVEARNDSFYPGLLQMEVPVEIQSGVLKRHYVRTGAQKVLVVVKRALRVKSGPLTMTTVNCLK